MLTLYRICPDTIQFRSLLSCPGASPQHKVVTMISFVRQEPEGYNLLNNDFKPFTFHFFDQSFIM